MKGPATLPPLAVDAHKGTAGRLLGVAGSRDMPGAAVLVARAAQHAGAGLVAMGRVHHSLQPILGVAAPEAVQVNFERWIDWKAFDPHARVIGPGLEASLETRTLVQAALALDDDVPLVIDAGRLEHLRGGAGSPGSLARPSRLDAAPRRGDEIARCTRGGGESRSLGLRP